MKNLKIKKIHLFVKLLLISLCFLITNDYGYTLIDGIESVVLGTLAKRIITFSIFGLNLILIAVFSFYNDIWEKFYEERKKCGLFIFFLWILSLFLVYFLRMLSLEVIPEPRNIIPLWVSVVILILLFRDFYRSNKLWSISSYPISLISSRYNDPVCDLKELADGLKYRPMINYLIRTKHKQLLYKYKGDNY